MLGFLGAITMFSLLCTGTNQLTRPCRVTVRVAPYPIFSISSFYHSILAAIGPCLSLVSALLCHRPSLRSAKTDWTSQIQIQFHFSLIYTRVSNVSKSLSTFPSVEVCWHVIYWKPTFTSITVDAEVGYCHVNPRFHPTSVAWNLGWMQRFQAPVNALLYCRSLKGDILNNTNTSIWH